MAFSAASFKTRTFTAALFVLVMLAGLLWNWWSFFVLFSVIHFGCWVEFQRLAGLIDKEYKGISAFHRYGVMIAGWFLLLYFSPYYFHVGQLFNNQLNWLIASGTVLMAVVIDGIARKRPGSVAHSLFGFCYISLPWAVFINLYNYSSPVNAPGSFFTYPWWMPAVVIGCMWVNDTMAYMVGSLIGKTPLSKISPNKTWEGTLGGIILCVAVVGTLLSFTGLGKVNEKVIQVNAIHWYVVAGIAAISGTIGDLLESKLKRLANVKDSGHIMPGHGGFLDRFDSLLLAAPFVWLYVKFFLF